jgi:hypothetical protein
MNGRISKKIHKEVKSNTNKTITAVFDSLNQLPLKKRIQLAIKLVFKKL